MNAPARYRKKPVVIDAILWTGENKAAVFAFLADEMDSSGYIGVDDHELYIRTLEGSLHASIGDWLIRGVQGEFYPCKPDIFEATYEDAA